MTDTWDRRFVIKRVGELGLVILFILLRRAVVAFLSGEWCCLMAMGELGALLAVPNIFRLGLRNAAITVGQSGTGMINCGGTY